MPPPKLRIHSGRGGKVKLGSKFPPIHVIDSSPSPDKEEAERQFEIELCWCVQQLEITIQSGKLNPKQIQDAEKNLKILKSPTQMNIKKRQLMRTLFGDYRNKMAEEEKQMYCANSRIKFNTKSLPSKKSYFIKKSALRNLGKEFKFNFDLESKLNSLKLADSDKNDYEPGESSNQNPVDHKACEMRSQTGSSDVRVQTDNSFRFNFHIEE